VIALAVAGPGPIPAEPGEGRLQFTLAALRAHQERQRVVEAAAGDPWSDSGFVFTSVFGTAPDPANISRAFNALLLEAALPHMRLHRHAAATLMLSDDVDIRTVLEILGHSQVGHHAEHLRACAPAPAG
jgi:integrase